MTSRSLVPALNLFTLFALFFAALWPADPSAATTGDTGSGLDPDGRP